MGRREAAFLLVSLSERRFAMRLLGRVRAAFVVLNSPVSEDMRGHKMFNIKSTHPLWVLICALALVIGLTTGQMAMAEQNANTQSLTNFRDDYPLKEYRD